MSTNDQTPPPGVSPEEFAAHLARQTRHDDTRARHHARKTEGIEFTDIVKQLATLPPETPEEAAEREKRRQAVDREDRLARFRKVCPPEFMQKIDRAQLANPAAFDTVRAWTGRFPGLILTGDTGKSKTRAAWSVLGRLNVEQERSIAWFPVKRLLTEFLRYESKDLADEFWRNYRGFHVLFVDDIDKINWQFESEGAALFQFYDWVYREQRPCITTTNKPRSWWADKQGDAFARRLFDDAHSEVDFNP